LALKGEGFKMFENLVKSDVLKYFNDTSHAWESYEIKKFLKICWLDWLKQKDWKIFVTLTFKNEVFPDIARRKLKLLIRKLNECVFGLHYTKFVGHSYFSYIAGLEYQRRGVIHFHLLIDKPVNFHLMHEFWNEIAGFAHVQILRDLDGALDYVTKYVIKCGQMEVPFFQDKDYKPLIIPYWWNVLDSKCLEPRDNN